MDFYKYSCCPDKTILHVFFVNSTHLSITSSRFCVRSTERLFDGENEAGRAKAVDHADLMQMCWLLSLKQSEPEDMIITISAENVVSMFAGGDARDLILQTESHSTID